MMGRGINSSVSSGSGSSLRMVPRCLKTPPGDFTLTGSSFESFKGYKYEQNLHSDFSNYEFDRNKKNLDITALSKKVKRLNLVNVLRRNMKARQEMQKIFQSCWTSVDSTYSDEDSVLSCSIESIEDIKGLKGTKAVFSQ